MVLERLRITQFKDFLGGACPQTLPPRILWPQATVMSLSELPPTTDNPRYLSLLLIDSQKERYNNVHVAMCQNVVTKV